MRDNKCNAFTSLEQSRKLAEILPIESADMYWDNSDTGGRSYTIHIGKSIAIERNFLSYKLGGQICAWSLTALLDVLPNGIVINKDAKDGKYHVSSLHIETYIKADNLIDACYEMILKLHELKML